MKSFLMLFSLLIPTWSVADDSAESRSLVTTSGKAEIRVVPDLADLWFDVEVRNTDLAQARKQQAERVEKVVKVLRAAGIQDADLQTSQLTIAPNFVENRQETATIQFYSVSQSVTCTVKDIKSVPDITAQVLDAGATGSRPAGLRSSEFRKHRDEARLQAIRTAKEKAIALATELGAKVGKPHKIAEESESWWSAGYNIQSVGSAGEGNSEFSSAFAPGTISITASVNVSFILE
jgi:uncharacterized protein